MQDDQLTIIFYHFGEWLVALQLPCLVSTKEEG
jgi:hypothetical protein